MKNEFEYSPKCSITLNTSGFEPGHYLIEVWVRDGTHNPESSYDATSLMNFTILENDIPTIYGLIADPPLHQVVCNNVKLTAYANDSENDDIYYKFLINGRPQGDWRVSNKWSWETKNFDIGTYNIKAIATDAAHIRNKIDKVDPDHSKEIFYELTGTDNRLPKIVGLSPDKSSPQNEGTIINWNTRAIDQDETDTIYYRFYLSGPSTGGIWQPQTDWSDANTWQWKTSLSNVGENLIEVRIKDNNYDGASEYDDSQSSSFVITRASSVVNSNPEIVGLSPDKSSPQNEGTIINWNTRAIDQDETDTIYYRFYLSGPSTGGIWQPQTDWSDANTWQWKTSLSNVGENLIEVRIKDNNYDGASEYDDSQSSSFVITRASSVVNSNPEIVGLSPDKSSSQNEGTIINWNARAIDQDETDTIYYRFYLSGPSTGGIWQPQTDWSDANTWQWKTSLSNVGENLIEVRIKDNNYDGASEYDDSQSSSFVITRASSVVNSNPEIVGLSPDKSSPQNEGTIGSSLS